ncbi:hypothetical protein KR018_010303 [Drosophila ironensis]|nr:hypothetical protein KR018_010303 [Drosophila ironensis]
MPRQRSDSRSAGSSRRGSTSTLHAPKPSRGSSKNLPAVQQPKKETVPAAAPPKAAAPTAPPAAESKGRSTGEVFKDMATTAAGVAAGSAVGHAVGAGITGIFSGRGQTAAAPSAEAATPAPSQRSELVEDGPCAAELRKFLKCTEENTDISVCKEFNEAVQQCRRRYNV